MPYIDVDIDTDDFYRECGPYEKRELAKWLSEDGYIDSKDVLCTNTKSSPIETLFIDSLLKIQENYINLSQEEIDLISKIAKKY